MTNAVPTTFTAADFPFSDLLAEAKLPTLATWAEAEAKLPALREVCKAVQAERNTWAKELVVKELRKAARAIPESYRPQTVKGLREMARRLSK